MMEPLVFEPYLRPQVWGGRLLGERFGKKLPATGAFGESWEISGHPQHVSKVAEGPLAGALLTNLIAERGEEIFGPVGTPTGRFPLLIKLLDCNELLSVQVHPNDQLARKLLSEPVGKTEAWVVLDVRPGGRIYAGLKKGVDKAEVERRLDDGTVAECMDSFSPRVGDCLFIPAGLVHAVGGGVALAEVQQTSDATFRLFDWNRLDASTGKPRALHRATALESIAFGLPPGRPVQPTNRRTSAEGIASETLVACPYFQIERHHWNAQTGRNASLEAAHGRFAIWLVLDGAAVLEGAGYQRRFRSGDAVLAPAAAPPLKWLADAPSVLLEVTLP